MKRGQIDQIITSVLALFIVFILMVIFFVISSNIGKNRYTADSKKDTSDFLIYSPKEAVASRAMHDLFLTDRITLSSGEKLSTIEGFETVSKAIQSYSVGDARALAILDALQVLFNSRYSCGGVNHFTFMVRNPSGSASIGSYWMYIDLPTREWKGTRLDAPTLQPNIVDLINGRVSNPSNYQGATYDFLDGLELPSRNNYIVYPRSDVLNERPPYIVLIQGAVTC